ncbi:MAG: 1-deoxy-D-xylulose-5-phosphate reductoisomerase [Balneolaceae bacterium]
MNMNKEESFLSHKRVAILGSTGSIGTQALEIIKNQPEHFSIAGLTAYTNWKLLAKQVNEFRPEYAVLGDPANRSEFENALTYKPKHILYGTDSLIELATSGDADVVLNSLVGFAGFMSTYEALKKNKKVALANKESLVVGGEILTALPTFKDNLVPVDSEHSAMLQCIIGEKLNAIQKIIITASGGPFKDWSYNKMQDITVKDALNHPNWDMGNKITIDSSTMMNKGLEIIEAHWLFGVDIDNIEPVVHPQSIIHSIIEFVDGSSKAQMGPPDMKVPILYALTYPNRIEHNNGVLDFRNNLSLTFEPVDYQRFPCIQLAIESVKKGGVSPTVLNASNEIAVARFLNKEISYIQIPEIIETSLERIQQTGDLTPQLLFDVDEETRKFANSLLQ